MSNTKRVRWSELRVFGCEKGEWYFVISDMRKGIWEFFEKSTWETQWNQIPYSTSLADKAERLLGIQAVLGEGDEFVSLVDANRQQPTKAGELSAIVLTPSRAPPILLGSDYFVFVGRFGSSDFNYQKKE